MKSVFYISLFWTIYGFAGLFGFQIIPEKYKEYSWTKEYIRFRGKSWLMVGMPYLCLCFVEPLLDLSVEQISVALVVLGIPSVVYSLVKERKYKSMLIE